MVVPVNNDVINNDVAPSHIDVVEWTRCRNIEGIEKYRSIAIPLGISIELLQASRYFDISNIEPALIFTVLFHGTISCTYLYSYRGMTAECPSSIASSQCRQPCCLGRLRGWEGVEQGTGHPLSTPLPSPKASLSFRAQALCVPLGA